MNSKTIKLSIGDLEVKQLPLKKYADLLKQLQELPKYVSELEGLENEQVLQKLPLIIAYALPEVINILATATDLERETIENLSLDEVVDIFIAIFEVNKYGQVYDKVKKAMSQSKSNK